MSAPATPFSHGDGLDRLAGKVVDQRGNALAALTAAIDKRGKSINELWAEFRSLKRFLVAAVVVWSVVVSVANAFIIVNMDAVIACL